jgi:hypothetical protein
MFNQYMAIAIDKNPDAVIGPYCNAYCKTIGAFQVLVGEIFYELFADHGLYWITNKNFKLIKEGTKVPSTIRHEYEYAYV